jgi:hypothetical protein
MKNYRFECYDGDDKTSTIVEFDTECDAWSGFDGPMYKFFTFLKGCGFVFDMETEIGVVDKTGDFSPAVEL